MARIRSIHPGLFTDEAFIQLSMQARLLFIGALTEADDQGVFEWKPVTLKIRIFPADDAKMDKLLDELVTHKVVMRFTAGEKPYGALRNFRKWQRPKSPVITHPCPSEVASFTGLVAAKKEKPERGTALGRILAERQNHLCHYCECEITFYRKKPNSLEIDHRIPMSRGGSDDISNLVATCRPCNSLKANMSDVEFLQKFAPAELRERHASRLPKTDSGEIPPQREEGGGREGPAGLPPEEQSSPPATARGSLEGSARDTGSILTTLGAKKRA